MKHKRDLIIDCSAQSPLKKRKRSKRTIEYYHEFARAKNGECLSEKYEGCMVKLLWRCEQKHEWMATPNSVTNKWSWCPHCAGKAKHTIEYYREFARTKRNGECLSEKYEGCVVKLLWRCEQKHEWMATPFSVANNWTWCPQCAIGRTERLCRTIIEDMTGLKFPKKRPWFMEKLELDGYNEQNNIAFEYNGRQHYMYIPSYFHRKGMYVFEDQQKRDIRKRELCKENSIALLIIPYTENHNLINFIKNEMITLGIQAVGGNDNNTNFCQYVESEIEEIDTMLGNGNPNSDEDIMLIDINDELMCEFVNGDSNNLLTYKTDKI